MEATTERQTTAKKPIVKKWMVITAAILIVILAAVLVMAFIPFKALSSDVISDYLYVDVYDQGNNRILTVKKDGASDSDKEYAALFEKGISATQYSVLRSVFEFNFVNSLRYKTQKVSKEEYQYDDDGYIKKDKEGISVTKTVKTVERVEVSGQDIVSKTQAAPGLYVLEFVYCEQGQPRKEIEVKDDSTEAKANKERVKTIKFDRIRIVFNSSKNMIEEYTMYAYNSDEVASGEAVVTPILIRMNTTKLYEKLCELRKIIIGSDDNGEYVSPEDAVVSEETPAL